MTLKQLHKIWKTQFQLFGGSPKDEQTVQGSKTMEEHLNEQQSEFKNLSSNPVLCDENCDPFFIKTDEYGYCKKCYKNLGYVRK